MFLTNVGQIGLFFFFFSSRRRHTRYIGDWSSDVCSSDLVRDEEDGRPGLLPDPEQLLVQRVPGDLVECAERLVHQQDARLGYERARDEIGRASCRERVEIAVAAESRKQK